MKLNLALVACCATFLFACPPSTPNNSCTPLSCANGCCTADGTCNEASASACGLNGAACSACGAGLACDDGVCRASATGGGAGMTGGGGGGMTGGGGGMTGGGGGMGGGGGVTGGGGGVTGGGGGVTGGGGGVTGGGSATGGGSTTSDAGFDCQTGALDATLGDLALRNGATVTQSATLPAGITTVGALGTTLYGVGTDKQLHRLGALPTLTLGPALASVLSPADLAADAGAFLGGSLATSGTRLLTGYTKSGAGFPGSVLVYDTIDAGVQHVSAPGNYTAAGFGGGFLINGSALATATGAGVYALDGQGAFALATFDSAWMASSGYTGVTANGIFLLGYFDGTDFRNHVRAAPASLTALPLSNRASFALSSATEVLAADDAVDFTTLGDDAVVVRGGYDSSFNPFTSRVERLPLTLTGSGVQTVTVGTPVTLLEASTQCTRVTFAVGVGSQLLVGLSDRLGRRVVLVQP